MRIQYNRFGTLTLDAEDGRDELFLAEMAKTLNFNKNKKVLNEIFAWTTEDYCVDEKGNHIEEGPIEVLFDKNGEVWPGIKTLKIN